MAYFRVPTTDKVKGLLNRRGRLEKIIDLVSSLPSSPNQGDRYIDLSDNKVKEYDGSVWQEYVPNEGDNLYVLNRDKYYYFDGTEWKDLTEIVSQWNKSGDTLTPKDADNIEINGSFIGDGSQLTGIKKLIEEFVAQGNVTAGDVVAFVNGKAKKGNSEIKYFEYTTVGTGNDKTAIRKLSDNKVFIAYSDFDNQRGVALIGTIFDDNIVFGQDNVFDNVLVARLSVSVLSSDKAVISYSDFTNNKSYSVVASISGNSISFGTKVQFYTAKTYKLHSHELSADKFVVCYVKTTTPHDGIAIIGEVSGTAITFGSGCAFCDTSEPSNIRCENFNSSKFCIVFYGDSAGRAIIGEVSGTAITFGSSCAFRNKTTTDIDVCVLEQNKFAVGYRAYDDHYGAVVVGTENNKDISYGTEYVFNNDITYSVALCSLANDKFLISYHDYNDNHSGNSIVATVNGNNISFGTKNKFKNSSVNFILNEAMTSSLALIQANCPNLKIVIAEIENSSVNYLKNYLNYIGISQETKNDGETTKVLIQGVSDVHSGLTVGQKYYADENGNLTTTETEDYIGIAISENKILLLDWQRPIMIYDGSNDEYIVPEKI